MGPSLTECDPLIFLCHKKFLIFWFVSAHLCKELLLYEISFTLMGCVCVCNHAKEGRDGGGV